MSFQRLVILSAQLLCPFQCDVDVATDVFLAQQFVEARFGEHLLHLVVHAREYHLDALFLAHLAQVGEVVYARRIYEGHLTHTDDAHLGTVAEEIGRASCRERV